MRTFLDDAWDEGMEKGLERGSKEHLIHLVYKKILRGQEPAQIADALEEEEADIREIYDIIERSLPDFDPEKVYMELEKEKATA